MRTRMRQEMKELAHTNWRPHLHNDGFMAKEHPILGGMEDLVVIHMGWFAGFFLLLRRHFA